MLNEFFSVLHEQQVKQASNRGLVDTLKRLPNEDLRKLASGELKLASYGDGDVDDWLSKYKGTPLFEKAVSLEQQKLELEANEQAMRKQRDEMMEQMKPEGMSEERDRLCLEKRVLDLELATSQEAEAAGAAGPAEALEQQEGQGLEQALAAHETEQAAKAAPPAPPPPAGGKGMTVSVKQDADKSAPAEETAQKIGSANGARVGDTLHQAGKTLVLEPKHWGSNYDEKLHGAHPKGARSWDIGEGGALKPRAEETAEKISSVQALAREMAWQDAKLAGVYGSAEEMQRDAEKSEGIAKQRQEHPVRTRVLNALGGAGVGGLSGAGIGSLGGPKSMIVGGAIGAGIGGGLGALGKPGSGHASAAQDIRAHLTPEALEASIAADREAAEYSQQNPGKVRATRALLGGGVGAGAGAALGNAFGRPGVGAAVGGGLGALASALSRPTGQGFTDAADADEKYLKRMGKKQAGIADLGAKALGAVKPMATSLAAGAKNVGAAFGSGGLKGALGTAGSVGKDIATMHPLGTAALAGGAGLAAGRMLGGGQRG